MSDKKSVMMSFWLPLFWRDKIEDAVNEGHYSNYSEVVRAGIRLVMRQIEEEKRQAKEAQG